MRLTPLCLLCILALTGCLKAPDPDPTFEALLDSIEQRLAIADAVALHKWDSGQPVQDSAREQQVLERVRKAASSHKVSPQRATLFFSDQIEADKLRQYHLLSQWSLVEAAPDIPRLDLTREIRPQLDLLQAQMLDRLARFDRHRPAHCEHALAKAIGLRSSDATRRLMLIRATASLCPRG
ncbi:chorismate mutase [Pseudomonas parafulva]|uniref:chorismate mutase n=1 Tax=Pseudomonas parafulva TaxID=157782 RepID=A0AAI8K8Q8_9PSED|nr:chorismate mutase [Pseudomonas parafulva]AXO86688.1 chorismate mutase [Pseudomonas parafulva]